MSLHTFLNTSDAGRNRTASKSCLACMIMRTSNARLLLLTVLNVKCLRVPCSAPVQGQVHMACRRGLQKHGNQKAR